MSSFKFDFYGGSCVNCGNPKFQKHDSDNLALIYEACPSCGFAIGHIKDCFFKSPQEESLYIWNQIFKTYHFSSIKSAFNFAKTLTTSNRWHPFIVSPPTNFKDYIINNKLIQKSDKCQCSGFTLLHFGCNCFTE